MRIPDIPHVLCMSKRKTLPLRVVFSALIFSARKRSEGDRK